MALRSQSNLDFLEFHLSYKDLEVDETQFFESELSMGLVVHSPDLFEGDHLLDLSSPRRCLPRDLNRSPTAGGRLDPPPHQLVQGGKPATDSGERRWVHTELPDSAFRTRTTIRASCSFSGLTRPSWSRDCPTNHAPFPLVLRRATVYEPIHRPQ